MRPALSQPTCVSVTPRALALVGQRSQHGIVFHHGRDDVIARLQEAVDREIERGGAAAGEDQPFRLVAAQQARAGRAGGGDAARGFDRVGVGAAAGRGRPAGRRASSTAT